MIASILALLASFIVGGRFEVTMTLWIALVSMLGSWAIMIPAKFTEGWLEDQAPRRFTQLVLGGMVGVAAWALASMLLLDMPMSRQLGIGPGDGVLNDLLGLRQIHVLAGKWDLTGGNALTLPVYAAYFGLLFLLLKWWRQAEFLRCAGESLGGGLVRAGCLGPAFSVVVSAAARFTAGRGDCLDGATFQPLAVGKPPAGFDGPGGIAR